MTSPRRTPAAPQGRAGRTGLPWARGAFFFLLVACGSRTGLFGTEDGLSQVLPDGGFPGLEGGTFFDATPGFDSAIDPDALPPIDATPPRDASRIDCPDSDATLIYVVTTDNQLYSFFPPDGSFTFISNIACPAANGANPFSMAVNRAGVAYVEFSDDRLYRVSTATGACVGTPFTADQQGFTQFGMGYATNDVGPTESLFIAGTQDPNSGVSPGLARIDSNTFALTKIGPFVPNISSAELTGTGDGRLFAFYTKNPQQGPNGSLAPSFIGEINTSSANVIAETAFPTVAQGTAWAFAFWGGDFFMFTAANGATSDVTRYRPSDGSVTVVATLPTQIVGAGVSTCAPAQ